MKIALCMFGQTRTAINSAKSVQNYFGKYIDDVDVFFHTWDSNTPRIPFNLRSSQPSNLIIEPPGLTVPELTHVKIKEIYKPINYYVENQLEFENRFKKMYSSITGKLVYLWHSAYFSNIFRRTFQKLHNIDYDLVVRLRPDCIFPVDRKFENDINEVLSDSGNYYIDGLFEDVLNISTPEIMNEACNFYTDVNFYGTHFWAMTAFKEYLLNKGINVVSLKDKRLTIFRENYEYLDAIDDYWQINAINFLVYENINYAKDSFFLSYQNENDANWVAYAKKSLVELFGHDHAQAYFNFFKTLN